MTSQSIEVLCQPTIAARPPRAEGELGDGERVQHVCGPASAEARLGKRGQERTADRGEALVCEHLNLGGVAGVGHVTLTLFVELTGMLEHGRPPE